MQGTHYEKLVEEKENAVSSYAQKAKQISFHEVKETCPDIDHAFQKLDDTVKSKTGELREALTDAFARALEAEARVDSLEQTVDELKERIKELENG